MELSSGGDDGLGTERPSGTSANYELNRELLYSTYMSSLRDLPHCRDLTVLIPLRKSYFISLIRFCAIKCFIL